MVYFIKKILYDGNYYKTCYIIVLHSQSNYGFHIKKKEQRIEDNIQENIQRFRRYVLCIKI